MPNLTLSPVFLPDRKNSSTTIDVVSESDLFAFPATSAQAANKKYGRTYQIWGNVVNLHQAARLVRLVIQRSHALQGHKMWDNIYCLAWLDQIASIVVEYRRNLINHHILGHRGHSEQAHPKSTPMRTHTNHCSPVEEEGLVDGTHALLQPLTGATDPTHHGCRVSASPRSSFLTSPRDWMMETHQSCIFKNRDGATGTPSSELPGATELSME